MKCKRCNQQGHYHHDCTMYSMPVDKEGFPLPVDPNDVFIHSSVSDSLMINRLPTDMWRVVISYLPVKDILPHIPLCCKYLNEEVVWHKWSGRLMWGEMGPGAIDKKMFTSWLGGNPYALLLRACKKHAPLKHVTALIVGGASVNTRDERGCTPLICGCCRQNGNEN